MQSALAAAALLLTGTWALAPGSPVSRRTLLGQGGAAAAAVVAAPRIASAEDFASNLKPLYDAAKKGKLTYRSIPGELGPEAFPEDAFVGSYTDPINHPGGTRQISLQPKEVGVFRLVKVAGGGGRGEPANYELPGLVEANRITVDFSPKGGPAGLTGILKPAGLYNGKATPAFILWPDGNKWPKTS